MNLINTSLGLIKKWGGVSSGTTVYEFRHINLIIFNIYTDMTPSDENKNWNERDNR